MGVSIGALDLLSKDSYKMHKQVMSCISYANLTSMHAFIKVAFSIHCMTLCMPKLIELHYFEASYPYTIALLLRSYFSA